MDHGLAGIEIIRHKKYFYFMHCMTSIHACTYMHARYILKIHIFHISVNKISLTYPQREKEERGASFSMFCHDLGFRTLLVL